MRSPATRVAHGQCSTSRMRWCSARVLWIATIVVGVEQRMPLELGPVLRFETRRLVAQRAWYLLRVLLVLVLAGLFVSVQAAYSSMVGFGLPARRSLCLIVADSCSASLVQSGSSRIRDCSPRRRRLIQRQPRQVHAPPLARHAPLGPGDRLAIVRRRPRSRRLDVAVHAAIRIVSRFVVGRRPEPISRSPPRSL